MSTPPMTPQELLDTFARMGIPAETVLAAGLLTYVYWVALAATGGAWMLYRRSPAARAGETA